MMRKNCRYHMTPVVSQLAVAYADWWLTFADSWVWIDLIRKLIRRGSMPVQRDKRLFLCYNMLGSVTTAKHDEYSHIEIDFHDTDIGPLFLLQCLRLPSFIVHSKAGQITSRFV